jgi:hypothetical protein
MSLIDRIKIRDGLDRSSTTHDRVMMAGWARAIPVVEGRRAEDAREQ